MSASDLPEAHRSPESMARCLVTYISDPERIRREVSGAFGSAPCVYTIKQMRERHLSTLNRPRDVFKAHEGYHPGDAFDAAQNANENFLRRLRAAYPERFAA